VTQVPSLPFRVSAKPNKTKAGTLVKEYIEDVKKEVRETKQNMSKGVDDA